MSDVAKRVNRRDLAAVTISVIVTIVVAVQRNTLLGRSANSRSSSLVVGEVQRSNAGRR